MPAAPPPTLTSRDRGVVASLALLLAVIGVAIAGPSLSPLGAVPLRPIPSSAVPAATPAPDPVLRLGVVGTVTSVNPLTAVTRPERDLAALVFAGLVRLGPGNAWEPGLAERWTLSDDLRTWTFELDPEARWHDGTPVTSADVVFTVDLLHDPDVPLAGAASWRDVTATAVDDRTVRFELGTPLGGFIEAARQPLLPAHLLDGVTAEELATHPFGRAPIGAGPYQLVALDDEHAVLEPADEPDRPVPPPSPTDRTTDPLATPPRAAVEPPKDQPADLDVRFHDDAMALENAWTEGEIDMASELSPEVATRLDAGDSRIVRYPTTTLTAVLLNQRLDHPELRDRAARRALLQGIDREALVAEAWNDLATVAMAPIPPSSWAFDPAASDAIPYDRRAAAAALDEAGWTPADGRWTAPGGSEPYTLELLSPDVASSTSTFEAAASVAADLRRVGLTVEHVALPPADLVGERLRAGAFDAAVVDVNVGLDPDLYPLLASSQIRSTGLNFSGVVERDLDRLLVAARTPGAAGTRLSAHTALQERLAAWQYLLPLAFRDEVVLARNTVSGVSPRLIGEAGDRFHDVLAWRLADDRGGG